MARKLRVELDVDTDKAKSKVKRDLSGPADGGSSPGGGSGGGPSELSRASDSAAKSIDDLGKSSGASAHRIASAAKLFGGMAVRMATAYAASRMEQDSGGQKAVSAAGEVAGGALQGAMFGPIGAAAGGLMGAATALMKAAQESEAAAQAMKSVADASQASREQWLDAEKWGDFADTITQSRIDYGGASGKKLLEMQIEDMKERRAKAKEQEEKFTGEALVARNTIKDYSEGRIKLSDDQLKEWQDKQTLAQGRESSMHGIGKALDRQIAEAEYRLRFEKLDKPAFRTSDTATNALARIGANIGGEADLKQTMEKQLSKQDEMLTQMKIIMRDGVIVKGAETLWK